MAHHQFRGRLGGVLVSALLASAAILPAAAQAAPAPAQVPEASTPSLTLPPQSYLESVYCTSKSNCWAVGNRYNGRTTSNWILHWNGRAWRNHAVPSPGGSAKNGFNDLYAVRCVSASDCWAVGEYLNVSHYLNQALHWNGARWRVIPVPSPGGTGLDSASSLNDVTCTSSASCWSVGDYTLSDNTPWRTQALHWNGRTWSRRSTASPGGSNQNAYSKLEGVRCLNSRSCFAAGYYGRFGKQRNLMLHWNGRRWSLQRVPNPTGPPATDERALVSIGCGSSSLCFAGGQLNSTTKDKAFNQILRWNGRRWSRVPAPELADSSVYGTVCVTASDSWGVGLYRGRSVGAYKNMALHWNGRRWSVVPTPNPAGTGAKARNILVSARCTSASNCWAVGNYGSFRTNKVSGEMLHWNGRRWSVYHLG